MNAPVITAAGIRSIPHLCSCTQWESPDYRLHPGLRVWTLRAPDAGCALHGQKSGSEKEGSR